MIQIINKALDDYIEQVEPSLRDKVSKKVKNAKGFFADSMGAREYTDIIIGGLQPEYTNRIGLSKILTSKWIKEAALQTRFDLKILDNIKDQDIKSMKPDEKNKDNGEKY